MSPKHENNGKRLGTARLQVGAQVETLELRIDAEGTEEDPDPSAAKRVEVLTETAGEVLLAYTVQNPEEDASKDPSKVTIDTKQPEKVTGSLLRATAQPAIEGAGGDFYNSEIKDGRGIKMDQLKAAGLAPPEAA